MTLAQQRIAALEAELSAMKSERDTLREAYTAVKLELELLKKRLFVAKAERVDVAQLELEFAVSWRSWMPWRSGSSRCPSR